MENKFNINDLELLLKGFKYCYFLEGDDKTHKRLDNSLEALKRLRHQFTELVNLMEANTSTKWDFELQHTFDCIVTDDGVNEHYEQECSEFYTGSKIWDIVKEIKQELKK